MAIAPDRAQETATPDKVDRLPTASDVAVTPSLLMFASCYVRRAMYTIRRMMRTTTNVPTPIYTVTVSFYWE